MFAVHDEHGHHGKKRRGTDTRPKGLVPEHKAGKARLSSSPVILQCPGQFRNNAGTPADITGRLRQEITAILESPETRKRFEAEGGETSRMSAQEFSDLIAAETVKWTRVVKRKPE